MSIWDKYSVPYRHVTLRDWQDASNVGGAINLSGIVMSWADTVTRIRRDCPSNQGTDWVNQHPINVIYADAVATLSGAGVVAIDTDNYRFIVDQLTVVVDGRQ